MTTDDIPSGPTGAGEEVTGEVVAAPVGATSPTASNLFAAQNPVEVIERATVIANALKAMVVSQGLIVNVKGNQYPKVEAWQTLGGMLGVRPFLAWVKPVEGTEKTWTRRVPVMETATDDAGNAILDGDGQPTRRQAREPDGSPRWEIVECRGSDWVARYEARTTAGEVIGLAEAMCTRSENRWREEDDYQLCSMAQTRATSRALRSPLGWVMALAGYQTTPAEDMANVASGQGQQRPAARPKPSVTDELAGEDRAAYVLRVSSFLDIGGDRSLLAGKIRELEGTIPADGDLVAAAAKLPKGSARALWKTINAASVKVLQAALGEYMDRGGDAAALGGLLASLGAPNSDDDPFASIANLRGDGGRGRPLGDKQVELAAFLRSMMDATDDVPDAEVVPPAAKDAPAPPDAPATEPVPQPDAPAPDEPGPLFALDDTGADPGWTTPVDPGRRD